MQSKKKVDKAIDAIFWIGLSDPTSFIFRQRLNAFLYKVIKCCVFSFFLPLSFHVKKTKVFWLGLYTCAYRHNYKSCPYSFFQLYPRGLFVALSGIRTHVIPCTLTKSVE